MEPTKALEIVVSLLNRTPMSPAEMAGAQVAISTLETALAPKDPAPAATPETPPPSPAS